LIEKPADAFPAGRHSRTPCHGRRHLG
jgi:hypothetical protein